MEQMLLCGVFAVVFTGFGWFLGRRSASAGIYLAGVRDGVSATETHIARWLKSAPEALGKWAAYKQRAAEEIAEKVRRASSPEEEARIKAEFLGKSG